MTYNLTNFTAANNFLDMAVASNYLVDGWLATLVLVMIFGISFLALKNYAMGQALLTSSFVTFLLAASMWGVGFMGERGVVISFVLLLFAIGINAIID